MNEHQVREHVRKLSRFYTDALIYAVVNLGLIIIWAISGGGYFWPIWVIIGWGIGLGVHAFSLGLIPHMNAMVPFMTAEWEDKEIRRLMEAGYQDKENEEKRSVKTETKSKKTSSVTQAEEVKPTVKKASAVKKAKAKPKALPKAKATKVSTKKKTTKTTKV